MKKFSEIRLQDLGHMTAICLLAASVTACGGSSGGISGGNAGDDGNNTDDLFGNNDTTDTDGDGVTDVLEAQLGTDPDVFDSDIDSDGDGVSNFDEITGGTDPAVADSIVIDNGDTTTASDCDTNSDTPEWGDNCTIREGGSFATSSYTKGVQRILWCQGYDAATGQNINTFADGIFGPNTTQAVRDFQTANNLAVDGEVGKETWPKLFDTLSLIRQDIDFDVHTINGINCSSTDPQFYQTVNDGILDGWKMADIPGGANTVDFGTAP